EDGQRSSPEIPEPLGEARGERARDDGDGDRADQRDADAEDLTAWAGVAGHGAAVEHPRDRPPEPLDHAVNALRLIGRGAGRVVEQDDGAAEQEGEDDGPAQDGQGLDERVEAEEAIDPVTDPGADRLIQTSPSALRHGIRVVLRTAVVNPASL